MSKQGVNEVATCNPIKFSSEPVCGGYDGFNIERYLQLRLYAEIQLALRRDLLQNIAVHSKSVYMRIGIFPHGYIHRQVSTCSADFRFKSRKEALVTFLVCIRL